MSERGFLLHVFHRLHKGHDALYAVGKLENGETTRTLCAEASRQYPILTGGKRAL